MQADWQTSGAGIGGMCRGALPPSLTSVCAATGSKSIGYYNPTDIAIPYHWRLRATGAAGEELRHVFVVTPDRGAFPPKQDQRSSPLVPQKPACGMALFSGMYCVNTFFHVMLQLIQKVIS